ncbi:uncharacterized protein LOC111685316 [Lucilia cuprina]|uniref:uncharacterized protein LOC111685316 n=1 Tax=Lucilia cuprina TaxID=7375 RepID=UPI001F068225|nr:uncharacterized protein LOC111685316 [Lucilia cuprina]
MVNFKNYTRLILCLLIFVCDLTVILTFSSENHSVNVYNNETQTLNHTKQHYDRKTENIDNKPNDDDDDNDNKDAKIFKNATDLAMAATEIKRPQQHLPVVIKPRGFHLPKSRPVEQKQTETQQPAAQNYYSHYFSDLPPLEHLQPYFPLTEDPIIAKFLSQQNKQLQQQPRHQPYSPYDASILGSGDFGILRGGTFYSAEDQSYSNEEASDIYYGDASNTHTISSTEGFIQKYTFPEEQFAQFRDFADLATPADSAFSQYVVVYAAKNATAPSTERRNSKPKNIFEQLQEIDKEKALEQKKLRKNQTNTSITKLKLVKTKLYEKKWVQKQPVKVPDDDPLIALS